MKSFFLKIERRYSPKNLYQEAVIASLNNYDHLIIGDISKLVVEIEGIIKTFHKLYKRCKILDVKVHSISKNEKSLWVSAGNDSIICVSLFEVKEKDKG